VRKHDRDNKDRYVPVIQFSKDGNIITKYDSIAQAALATGCHKQSISGCCRNKIKTTGGYIWKYAADVNYIDKDDKINQLNN